MSSAAFTTSEQLSRFRIQVPSDRKKKKKYSGPKWNMISSGLNLDNDIAMTRDPFYLHVFSIFVLFKRSYHTFHTLVFPSINPCNMILQTAGGRNHITRVHGGKTKFVEHVLRTFKQNEHCNDIKMELMKNCFCFLHKLHSIKRVIQ